MSGDRYPTLTGHPGRSMRDFRQERPLLPTADLRQNKLDVREAGLCCRNAKPKRVLQGGGAKATAKMTGYPENQPTLYGFDTSTYTQIVLLTLAAKGVAHRYDRVANWVGDTKHRDFRELNPFGLIPVLEHNGIRLYETLSIAEYIDEGFPGPSLKPVSVTDRARMCQLIAVHDHHVRRPWVTIISGERDFAPLAGQVPDEEAIKSALPAAALAADVLDDLLGSRSNAEPDLADYWLVPATRFFTNTPEGAAIIEKRPALMDWWQRMAGRKPVAETYKTVVPTSS